MATSCVTQVGISGPTFASLLYEIVNSSGDQEGFLIGETTTNIIDGISDSQLNYERKEVVISVHYVVPCDNIASFYNSKGQIDEEAVKKCIGPKYKDLIGWYRFRRNTSLNVFLRERAIHENLLRLIPLHKKPFFLFAIFGCVTTKNVATHTVDHVFLRYNKSSFEGLSLTTVNLGDTSQSDYKQNLPLVLDQQSTLYSQLTNASSNHTSLDTTGISSSIGHITNVQTTLQYDLRKLCQKVSNTEKKITSLKDEIEELNMMVRKSQSKTASDIIQPTLIKDEIKVVDSVPMLPPMAICASKSSANELEKTIGRLTLVTDKRAPSSLPKDVSGVENSLRKLGRPFPEPSMKLQVVSSDEDVSILADTGGGGNIKRESFSSLPKL